MVDLGLVRNLRWRERENNIKKNNHRPLVVGIWGTHLLMMSGMPGLFKYHHEM